MLTVKTVIEKRGNIEDYKHIPITMGEDKSVKVVGYITEVKEVEEGYELTALCRTHLMSEFTNRKISSFSIG